LIEKSNGTLSYVNASGSGAINAAPAYDIYSNGNLRGCSLLSSVGSNTVSVYGGTCKTITRGASSTTSTTSGYCTGDTFLSPQVVTTADGLNTLLSQWSTGKSCEGVILLNPPLGATLKLSRRYSFEGPGANITILKSPSYMGSRIQLMAPNGDGHLSLRNRAVLTVQSMEFINSTGGSIRLEQLSQARFTGCVFRGNHDRNETMAGPSQYPALSAINATMACYNCTFKDNRFTSYKYSSGYGGSALGLASQSYGYFYDTIFDNNTVTVKGGSFSGGGAVVVDGATSVSFSRCTWKSNKVTALTSVNGGVRGGGAMVYMASAVTFSRCSFTSNTITAKANGTETGFGALIVGGTNGIQIEDTRYTVHDACICYTTSQQVPPATVRMVVD